MSEQAVADEPKDEKKPAPLKDESYTEKVSVRRFESGILDRNVVKDVPAFRYEKDGVLKFYTKAKTAATPTKGTELTDEKGTVYLVEKVTTGRAFHISTVKPKPKEQ